MSAFVDTSAFVAATNKRDDDNSRAHELLSSEQRLVTSDHVLIETWNVIMRTIGASAADDFWNGVREGGVQIETAIEGDLRIAWSIGQAFADQSFSIVDRTSFAVMERLGVNRVISFDDDFAIYRHGPKRDRAFEVLR